MSNVNVEPDSIYVPTPLSPFKFICPFRVTVELPPIYIPVPAVIPFPTLIIPLYERLLPFAAYNPTAFDPPDKLVLSPGAEIFCPFR